MNEKALRKVLAEREKAQNFIRGYYKDNGQMPAVDDVKVQKELTQEEEAKVDLDAQIGTLIDQASKEKVASWDYIYDENSWNESYENGALKDYYVWADEKGSYPYKEDLWNTVENRAANWNDIEKDENGTPIEYEDGYHYANCVRCWNGAINAPGAQYPWCGLKFEPFNGCIRFVYDGGEAVYPWGNYKEFKRTFGIASIPEELGSEYKLDGEGHTTFDPSKLIVTLIYA